MIDPAFEEALKATGGALERKLDPMLPVPEGPEARVVEAMRYAMYGPGKRLRPFLVMAASELFAVPKAQSLRVAIALECVHTYSLIHDDLPAMDDDDLRRGKPTVHKAFDEATAILAGDALLTMAFEVLADPQTHEDGAVRSALVSTLAQAAGHRGMVAGQMIDIAAETMELDQHAINRLQALKTGALIGASVEVGAILGQGDDKARSALLGYARALGLAFQIADDLLDAEGDTHVMGKRARKDAGAGKATFVSLLGVERAREQAKMLADQAIEHLGMFDERATLLRAAAHFAVHRAK